MVVSKPPFLRCSRYHLWIRVLSGKSSSDAVTGGGRALSPPHTPIMQIEQEATGARKKPSTILSIGQSITKCCRQCLLAMVQLHPVPFPSRMTARPPPPPPSFQAATLWTTAATFPQLPLSNLHSAAVQWSGHAMSLNASLAPTALRIKSKTLLWPSRTGIASPHQCHGCSFPTVLLPSLPCSTLFPGSEPFCPPAWDPPPFST